ncbi:MAG TPA: hypothetical protein DDZ88_11975 [Verrucomicrobiales bacterium]|nr:hypothetical protein [Verrucomicrobiales bacterium]
MKPPPLPATNWAAECRRFIEAGGNTTHAFGLGRMLGRVFAFLYLSPQAVSLEDIAARLQVSKASVSIVVRQLFEFQAVRHITLPGDRRDYYEAETDFLLILRRGIMPGFRKKLQTAGMQIERTLGVGATAGGGSAAPDGRSEDDQAEIRRRLRKAQALHRRLDQLLGSRILAKLL